MPCHALHAAPYPYRSPLLVPHLVLRVRQIQMPVGALGRQHHHANDTARAAVPPDGLLQGALDEVDGLGLLHALFPVGVAVSVDVGRARAADGVRALVQRTSKRDAVNLAAVALVPACDNEAGAGKGCQL